MKIEIDTRSAGLGALVVLLTAGAASPMVMRSDGLRFPDGTVQTTAAPSDSRNAFYLTFSEWDGASAPTACADGFHMASLWEILDPSTLRYAAEEPDALTLSDSGLGPPMNVGGWIRTGHQSRKFFNCEAYTTNSSAADGVRAFLSACWSSEDSCADLSTTIVAPWWEVQDRSCSIDQSVWCVED